MPLIQTQSHLLVKIPLSEDTYNQSWCTVMENIGSYIQIFVSELMELFVNV